METLQIPLRIYCHKTTENTVFKPFSLVGQGGFVRNSQKCRKIQSFRVKRSHKQEKNRGVFICRSSSNAQDKEHEEGLQLGTEIDSSGSVVGFQLIPQSATSDENLLKTLESVTNEEDEQSEDGETRVKISMKAIYNAIFVTSEAAPYSKTGGLGDVCGSLPIALAACGHRVMVVSPKYSNGSPSDKKFDNAVEIGKPIKIYCFGGAQEVRFFHEYRAGVDWVSVMTITELRVTVQKYLTSLTK